MSTQDVLTFVGFFFAGLAVNLTPCVYPMMTVTVSLFKPKKNSTESLRHSFTKALMYVLGIAVMYSSLGYLAASSGQLFGSALQNSWVLGAVAFMFFLLSLSMFGVFQLSVPGEVLHFFGRFRNVIYAGLFASGMLVGIFAAPCIGPPVLALLAVVAEKGDPRYGFWAFFIFSLGLGLPYLLLGTFSKFVTRLPKAGNWLIWVERFFGVVLIGFAIFYLSLALHWYGPQKSNSNSGWQVYSEEKLQQAIGAHKPVIIDFFAEWCLGCHELDQKVFSNPKIKAKLAQVVTLRVDATNIDEPHVQAAIDQYGVVGLPTVVFLDTKGQEIKKARVEGSASLKEFDQSMDTWDKQAQINFKN